MIKKIKKGSLSISFLSGKIMFRGIHYVTVDYMLYIQDGCITFAYWKPQFIADKTTMKATSTNKNSSGISTLKKTARLNIHLGNLQLHYYNSWKLDESLINNQKSKMNISRLNSNGDTESDVEFSRNCINSIVEYFSKKFRRNTAAGASSSSSEFRTNSNTDAADNSSENDMTEDLMQLFSVVNIRIQNVILILIIFYF